MEQYTLEQRLQIIKIYYKSGESLIQTLRALTPIYGQRNQPAKSTIQRLVKKFESTYMLHNVPLPVRQRNGRSVKNIGAASAPIQDDPN
uniref:Putative LOC100572414 [Acyrthosiphon pisum] n=1 Tax=Lepeophtheirus salmonis TaxID=72036 RepID=A0A0K2TFB6_LEPSM